MVRVLWSSDAAAPGGKSSPDVLAAWLRAHYARWSAGGASKASLLREIVDEMRRHGLAHRHARDVRSKINDLERSVRKAVEWRAKHSERLLRERGEQAGHAAIREGMAKLCRVFDQVGHEMAALVTGACASPTATVRSAGKKRSAATRAELQEESEAAGDQEKDEDGDDHVSASGQHAGPGPSRPIGMPQRSAELLPLNPHSAPTSAAHSDASPPTPKRQKTSVDEELRLRPGDLEKQVLRHELRRMAFEEERQRLAVEREKIQLVKEKALARVELRQAGVPENEINRLFPLP